MKKPIILNIKTLIGKLEIHTTDSKEIEKQVEDAILKCLLNATVTLQDNAKSRSEDKNHTEDSRPAPPLLSPRCFQHYPLKKETIRNAFQLLYTAGLHISYRAFNDHLFFWWKQNEISKEDFERLAVSEGLNNIGCLEASEILHQFRIQLPLQNYSNDQLKEFFQAHTLQICSLLYYLQENKQC